MSKRVADVLVETLQAAGVKTCYGVVGDTLKQIAHSIDRSEIDWVHVRRWTYGRSRTPNLRLSVFIQWMWTLVTGQQGLRLIVNYDAAVAKESA